MDADCNMLCQAWILSLLCLLSCYIPFDSVITAAGGNLFISIPSCYFQPFTFEFALDFSYQVDYPPLHF